MDHICVDCKVPKPITEFYGGQTRKYRDRRVLSKRCRSCRDIIEKQRQYAKENGLHVCTTCRLAKPIDQFCKNGKYIGCYCNHCNADHQREKRVKAGKPLRDRRRRDIGDESTGFVCSRCDIQKPSCEFKKRNDGRWSYVCRECKEKRFEIGRDTPKSSFRRCKATAAYRKLSWSLTFEQFIELRSKPCHYCTFPIQISSGVGIDRVDHLKGYEIDNVVSCCPQCNICKGDHFSLEEMELIGKVIKQIRENRVTAGLPPMPPRNQNHR